MRYDPDLASQVSQLQLDLEELKQAQFTSQDSGMRFYDVSPSPVTFTGGATTSYESAVTIYHRFTGDRQKPVLVNRAITLTVAGFTLVIDERTMGQRYTFDSADYSQYGDWLPYVTKVTSEDYQDFQLSRIYYYSSTPLTFTISTSTQATDTGNDIITYSVAT